MQGSRARFAPAVGISAQAFYYCKVKILWFCLNGNVRHRVQLISDQEPFGIFCSQSPMEAKTLFYRVGRWEHTVMDHGVIATSKLGDG